MSNEDTLSRVMLAESAVIRWNAATLKFAEEAVRRGIDLLGGIQEEMARVEADGSLTIYVTMGNGEELKMRVEPHEWRWAGPQNH